ncbi:MAG TPA: DUF47 family protein [Candidatus Acidoferrales bacterium]|nr:DUF47 family protein [Candidatus Acidoferrales bacterium]
MPSLFGRLMPRSQSFSTAFTSLAENTHEGSAVFVEMVEKYDGAEGYVNRIKEIEHAGDNMTHALLTHLNQTFITPFDREDIYMLAGRVDDVLDLIDAAARAFVTYRIARVRQGVVDLAKVLHQATGKVVAAVHVLGKQDHILDHCIEINRLENEGDRLSRKLIAELFDEEKDPVQIIKWKEIIETIETAVDKCEDVANVIETITLKNA